jgi:hypothetical protein
MKGYAMQKRVGFLINVLLLGSLCANEQTEMSPKERLQVQFNQKNAIIFLQEALGVIDQDLSMTRSFLMQTDAKNGFYQMQPAGFEFLCQDQQFNEMKQNMESLLSDYLKTLETAEISSPEYQNVIQGIFDSLVFLIAHVRWNMCEIQYDMLRSTVGYHQKADESLLKTYAVENTEDELISYSAYNKGKFSLLHPDNEALAPLVQRVQYEELSRCHQLYTALQAYVMHYYRVFGENEDTTTFLQNLVTLVENQFQEHSKRFTLDQILQFSSSAGIGRLLY